MRHPRRKVNVAGLSGRPTHDQIVQYHGHRFAWKSLREELGLDDLGAAPRLGLARIFEPLLCPGSLCNPAPNRYDPSFTTVEGGSPAHARKPRARPLCPIGWRACFRRPRPRLVHPDSRLLDGPGWSQSRREPYLPSQTRPRRPWLHRIKACRSSGHSRSNYASHSLMKPG